MHNADYTKEGEKVQKGERKIRKRVERWNQKRYSAVLWRDIFLSHL